MNSETKTLFSVFFATFLVGVLTFSPLVFAQQDQENNQEESTQDIVCENVPGQECQEPSENTVSQLTETATNILTTIIASVSVLALVVAGFMYILSAGNPDSINRAKNIIIYSLVGIAVAAFAQVIVRFVLSSL